MHLDTHQASLYVHKLAELLPKKLSDVEVVLAPSMLSLQSLSLQIDHNQFKLAAQNLYWRDEGAYTGEVSATMLRGVVKYALVGHSERRHVFGEREKDIRAKVQAALRNDIQPILCVGETASERANGETSHVLTDQVTSGLANVTSQEIERVIVAYEPVWAISSGKDFASREVPTPEACKQATGVIRDTIEHLFGAEAVKKIRILYGGSSNADNAAGLMNGGAIDGLLLGGASLVAEQFASMVQTLQNGSGKKNSKNKMGE